MLPQPPLLLVLLVQPVGRTNIPTTLFSPLLPP
jgi:hypothetical protein